MGDGAETEDLREAGAAAGRTVRRVRIVVIEGPDAPASFTATGDTVVVGTHPSAHLVLGDRTISRFHCRLEIGDDAVTIRDLASRNRTTVDAVEVEVARVRSGSIVGLGRTKLRVELGPQVVTLPISDAARFGSLVGRSVAIRTAFAQLERAAGCETTVLLHGETGTGKDVAADAIHRAGARAERPFVIVDCGAMPPDLLESELFGHERGAFTGAVAARSGAFEAADGGTIFLDEIGELGLALQPKLLRALESRMIRRLGSNEHRSVDVRVIAATNRDLCGDVNAGRFRADLYYRLAVLEVRLPPLRERAEDLPMLAAELLDRLGASADTRDRLLDRDSLEHLGAHAWPGNVRELRNYLERCLALREPAPLPVTGSAASPAIDAGVPFRTARDDFERRYLEALLTAHQGKVMAAARTAGLDRIHLYRLLRKHGLR